MGDYKWIGLIRKFCNCSFYNDSNAVQMFLHIFLNAQREDKPYFDQITMRGQFRTSIKDIMQFLEITRKSARRSLDKLKAAGIIHVSSLRRNGVLITVRDFSKFLALEHANGGWVKLYYDLDYQDFFVDAQVLHIYLHLLLHTYSGNENYEDPLWFDMKKISTATGISVEGIKESLQKLRKLGILNVGYNGQKKLSSVHLIEFSEYIKDTYPITSIGCVSSAKRNSTQVETFAAEATLVNPDEKGIKTIQKEIKEGPKESKEICSQNSYENATEYFVTYGNSVTYTDGGQKEGQKREQISPKDEATSSLPNCYKGGYAREPIMKENRDKRIEKNYNYNSLTQKFSSVEELVADEEWVSSMQNLYGFSDKVTLYTALSLFLSNLKCRKEKVPTELTAFLDYFCNWYKRNEKKLQKRLKVQPSPKDYPKILWGKCMEGFAKIVPENILTSIFQRITFESFDSTSHTLLLTLSRETYEVLENSYVQVLSVVLNKFFGKGVRLNYRLVPSCGMP